MEWTQTRPPKNLRRTTGETGDALPKRRSMKRPFFSSSPPSSSLRLLITVLPPRVERLSLSQVWYGTFCVGISLARSLSQEKALLLPSPTLPFKAAQTAAAATATRARRRPSPRALRSSAPPRPPARPRIQADGGGGYELYVFIGAVAVSLNFRARSSGRTDA